MRDFFVFDPRLLFYGFLISFFANYGQTFYISIYSSEIREFYNLTDGQFGLIYAIGTLLSSFILIGFAKIIDKVDLRIYSFVISMGLALSCLFLYIPYNSLFFLLLIMFGLRFFGQGAMSHAATTTMARYFGFNRGKAISVASFGAMIGVMILPLVVVKLTNLIGWRNVWLTSSLSILIFFIPFMFLILKDQKLRHLNFKETTKEFPDSKRWRTRDVARDKKFYVYLPISIASSFIGTGLTFHQIFIMEQKGWSLEMLAKGFVFLGFFSILGLFVGGLIIDKFNTRKVIVFTLWPLFFAILILLFFNNYFSMFFYMSLLGLNIGLGAPFIGSLWAELYGLESLGTVKALHHASMVFASALSPVLFGYIIDFGFSILSLCIMSFVIIIFSTLLPILYKNIE